jgi:hypothetical protein
MKDVKRRPKERSDERRRFLRLIGGAGFLGLAVPFLHGRQRSKELSLREADFYRDHDLAG